MEELFQLMAEHQLDFTLTFRRLADLAEEDSGTQPTVKDLFEIPDALLPWLARWRERQQRESSDPGTRQARMYAANPALIPRNHRVQEAIAAASDDGDFQPFHALHAALATPYQYHPSLAGYATPPRPGQEVRQTFCGT